MFGTRLGRALCVPAVLIPITIGTLAISSSASAAGPHTAKGGWSVKCAGLTGKIDANGTLYKCTGSGDTQGSGVFPTTETNPVVINWASGYSTTVDVTYSAGSKACPAGEQEFNISGTVVSSTTSTITQGQGIKGDVCENGQTGGLSLVRGDKFKI
jgi:hypothetical protein